MSARSFTNVTPSRWSTYSAFLCFPLPQAREGASLVKKARRVRTISDQLLSESLAMKKGAENLMANQHFPEALSLANRIMDRFLRTATLQDFAKYFASCCFVQQAVNIAQDMFDTEAQKAFVFKAIVISLIEKREFGRAIEIAGKIPTQILMNPYCAAFFWDKPRFQFSIITQSPLINFYCILDETHPSARLLNDLSSFFKCHR